MEEKTIVEKLQLAKYKEVVVLDAPSDSDYFKHLPSYKKNWNQSNMI